MLDNELPYKVSLFCVPIIFSIPYNLSVNTFEEFEVNVTKASEQGLQISNALRGFLLDSSDIKAKENYLKAVNELDHIMKELQKSQEYENIRKTSS